MQIKSAELKKIMEDYEFHDDIMDDDPEDIRMYKWAISQLPDGDRILFLLYTDLMSSRKVGKIVGVSHGIILKEVRKIRSKILEICKNYSS